METLIQGTSVELIKKWIHAMEQDIKKNVFYCVPDVPDHLYVTPINKARLLIMCSIFCITDNNNHEGSSKYIRVYKSEKSVKEAQKEMMAYFETMKELLEINAKGGK
ncbi:MAG: hypothetical protein WC875_02925 [Candidatus Absconditabacterales bacterium]|jgi:hypothetical protein